jgi:hypothetical protein
MKDVFIAVRALESQDQWRSAFDLCRGGARGHPVLLAATKRGGGWCLFRPEC